jgi:hypothetical protein
MEPPLFLHACFVVIENSSDKFFNSTKGVRWLILIAGLNKLDLTFS